MVIAIDSETERFFEETRGKAEQNRLYELALRANYDLGYNLNMDHFPSSIQVAPISPTETFVPVPYLNKGRSMNKTKTSLLAVCHLLDEYEYLHGYKVVLSEDILHISREIEIIDEVKDTHIDGYWVWAGIDYCANINLPLCECLDSPISDSGLYIGHLEDIAGLTFNHKFIKFLADKGLGINMGAYKTTGCIGCAEDHYSISITVCNETKRIYIRSSQKIRHIDGYSIPMVRALSY